MTKNRVILELHFDADQVTKALYYNFTGPEGSILRKNGRCAGTFHFPAKAEVEIKVVGTAKTADNMRFTITDLTLVSVSSMRVGHSPLSMFDENRACTQIADWSLPKVKEKKGISKTTMLSGDILKLMADNGQWEMSGYLSVLVEKNDVDGKPKVQARLFHFDPEGTVGTGGDIRE